MMQQEALIERFKAIWHKLDLPWMSPTKLREGHFDISVGDRAVVESELSAWTKRATGINLRRRKPQYIYKIVIPCDWDPASAVADGKLVLERGPKPFRGSFPVRYVVRIRKSNLIRLAQGYEKNDASHRIVEAQYYSS